jgi:hypothetical protein
MAFKKLWFWKPKQLTDRWAEVYAFSTEEFERPSIVVSSDKPTSAASVWHSSVDDDGNLVIHFDDDEDMKNTPPLWYVIRETERPHPNGPSIPMVFIYALYGDDFPSGTVVLEQDLIKRKFTGRSKSVGFLQLFKNDLKIQQIFVEKEWRRKRITLALFGVADLVTCAGGYDGFVHGGEVTTEDGEKLRQAWNGSNRLDPRQGSFAP